MSEQTDPPARRRRLPVWLFLFLLVLAAVSMMLHAAKLRRQGEVQGLCDQEAMIALTRPVEGTKARRARFYEIQYYLGYPMSISYTIADLIRRIDGIVRPLRLLDIQINAGMQELRFKLNVAAEAADPETARQRFAVFFKGFGNMPGMTQVSFTPMARGGPGAENYIFAVSGRVEWQ
jgi:hypothetical protein